MSDASFGSWSVDQSPIRIEYSLVVIEEIRHDVTEGFQRLSRGGIEVGGVLYGTREGRTLRILTMRPISCEHARGPGFLLSDADRKALEQRLAEDQRDPSLDGFVCAGWFISHTRSEVNLAEADLDLYNEYFAAPWQVTMVVRPGRGGSMRAGFFVREADGNVNGDQSYQEFNFPDRLAGVLDHKTDRRSGTDRRRGFRRERDESPEPTAPAPRRETPFPGFGAADPQYLPSPPPARKWPWLVVWGVLVVSLAYFGLRVFNAEAGPLPVSLALVEKEGLLNIEWNRTARPVTAAAKGTLAIVDGKETRNIALTPSDLASGRFAYQRKTGDIEVRLTVESADGVTVQEASRYLGQSPVKVVPDELMQFETRRAQMGAEVKRLQEQNGAQAQRIQQLERTLRILQNRLGVK
jgi:proteasome lid subunit RPN8/RPN11